MLAARLQLKGSAGCRRAARNSPPAPLVLVEGEDGRVGFGERENDVGRVEVLVTSWLHAPARREVRYGRAVSRGVGAQQVGFVMPSFSESLGLHSAFPSEGFNFESR